MGIAVKETAEPARAVQGQAVGIGPDTVARFVAAVAGALILHFGWTYWNFGKVYLHHEIAMMDFEVFGLAFALFGLALVQVPKWKLWTSSLVLIGTLFVTFFGIYVWIRTVPIYGTDDIAFQHYGAKLLLRGVDPYTVSMLPVLHEFHVPMQTTTFLMDGRLMDRMSWPAGSFLVFAPFVALGIPDLRWAVLLFQLMVIVVLFAAAPEPLRLIVLLPFLASRELVDFTGGGVTDFMWVLPLLLMIVWQRRPIVAGLFYGIACSIKQVPWFLGPFLLIYFLKRHGADVRARPRTEAVAFALTAVAVFLVVNGPFIIHDPRNWVLGAFEPAIGNLIPLGTGPSALTQLGFPVPSHAYVLVAAAIGLLLVVNYAVYFDRLRDAIWFFPMLVSWFLPRSLHNYFIYWIPVLALVLTRRETAVGRPPHDGG